MDRRENFFWCHSLFSFYAFFLSCENIIANSHFAFTRLARTCFNFFFSFPLFHLFFDAFSRRTLSPATAREWNAAYLCLNCIHIVVWTREFSPSLPSFCGRAHRAHIYSVAPHQIHARYEMFNVHGNSREMEMGKRPHAQSAQDRLTQRFLLVQRKWKQKFDKMKCKTEKK